MFQFSLLLVLAWGALAFGSEYAWAYAPLSILCIVPATLGLRARHGTLPATGILVAAALIFTGAVAQLLLPASAIPGQPGAGSDIDFSSLYALATTQLPPESAPARISIAPGRTLLGIAFLTTFTVLLAGCTRGISAAGAKTLARGIAIIGVAVAFVGVVQSAAPTETIYGFWRRPKVGAGFAPFINENHFAGWMAMVLSLTIGSFAGDISSALKDAGGGWRQRILWFSTPRASVMLLTAFAIGIMALSMVLTFSRGGLVGLATVGLVGLWWMLRRQSGPKRLAGATAIGVLVASALMWGGAEKTIDQFSGVSEDFGGRKQIWLDTLNIIRDFPITGTGLNTFGVAMLHYQSRSITGVAISEAHNDYLQLASEGGLLLGIPILFGLVLFIREIWRRFREGGDDADTYWLRAGAVTGLLTIAGMELFDFTLQMPGAAAMFVLLAALAIHKPNHLHMKRSAREGRRHV